MFPLTVAVGLVSLAGLALAPNATTRMLAWPWWAVWQITLVLPAVLLAAMTRSHNRRPPLDWRPAFDITLVLFLLVSTLAALTGPHPAVSLGAVTPLLGAVTLTFLLRCWLLESGDAERRLQLGLGVAGLAFAFSSMGLWGVTDLAPHLARIASLNALAGEALFRLNLEGVRNEHPLGHSNYTAGAALLLLPWSISLALRARGWWRAAAVTGCTLLLAALVTSQSRGAFLGAASGGGVALLLLARNARWPWRRTAAVALAGALALVLAAAAMPRVRRLSADFLASGDLDIGDQQRLGMLCVGGLLGAERWWIGQGPGLTPRLYPHFRHMVDGGVDSALQLHSTPLQLWADTGVPGVALAGLIAAFALLAPLLQRRWTTAPERMQGLAAPAAASFAAYGGFALTDYQLDVPLIGALLAVDLAILSAILPVRPVPSLLARSLPWAAAASTLGWAVAVVPAWRARSAYAYAVEALESQVSSSVSEERMQRAIALADDDPWLPAGAAAAHLRLLATASDHGAAALHRASAQRYLRAALAAEPAFEFAHFNLGWLILSTDPAGAASHFRAAARLVPDRGGVYLGLALALFELNDIPRAIDALALELLNDPAMVAAPLWDTSLLHPHLQAAILQARALSAAHLHDPAFTDRSLAARWRAVDDFLGWWQNDIEAAGRFSARLNEVVESAPEGDLAKWPGLAILAHCHSHPGGAERLIRRHFIVRRHREPSGDELAIVTQLLATHGTDWRAWLLDPAGREPPFLRTERRSRPGFAILARNVDIPTPVDAYVVQGNELLELFFREAIPTRGHLPDSDLIEYVAARDL